jgi:hypothetical protein
MTGLIRFAPLLALVVAAASPLLLPVYQVEVITYVMIAAIACLGLVLMTGIAGMVSFGHAAFVGLGAWRDQAAPADVGAPQPLQGFAKSAMRGPDLQRELVRRRSYSSRPTRTSRSTGAYSSGVRSRVQSSRSAMSPLRAAVGIEVLADVLELAELRSELLRVRGPAESEPGPDRQRYYCLELHCRSLPELQWLCVGAGCLPLRSFRMDLKCGRCGYIRIAARRQGQSNFSFGRSPR